jgi:hypothetical protein
VSRDLAVYCRIKGIRINPGKFNHHCLKKKCKSWTMKKPKKRS